MATKGRRGLPFRIPLFRIFYSITYTTLYLVLLLILAVTPISLIYTSIKNIALQYVFMIAGTYVLTLSLAVFVYSSRLYTNRSVLAAVGKAYIPVEDGEVSKGVRKMIVKQLERSAIVAWEGRPRDVYGEILEAEKAGFLPSEALSYQREGYTVGTIVHVDPRNPHWGNVEHPGWSSPSHQHDNPTPNVQFAKVVSELPHLIEARAVSLAPPNPAITPITDEPRQPDPAVFEILQRPANMALREYLTQIGYLGLIQPPYLGENFLALYEKARFAGKPSSEAQFALLMEAFAQLLSGMTGLDPAIVREIQSQRNERPGILHRASSSGFKSFSELPRLKTTLADSESSDSISHSPVTARERISRSVTPYTQRNIGSEESVGSVITHRHDDSHIRTLPVTEASPLSSSGSSLMSDIPSDAGSVLWHDTDVTNG